MATDPMKQRQPAPVVKPNTTPLVYDLFDHNNERVTRFPTTSPKGTLTILRFVAPNAKNPSGTVVTGKYPPFDPAKIGFSIRERK